MKFFFRTLFLALLSAGTAYFLTPFIVAQGLLTPLLFLALPLLASGHIVQYLNLSLGLDGRSNADSEGLPKFSWLGLSVFVAGVLAYWFWPMVAASALWVTLLSAISTVSAAWWVGGTAFLWGAFYPRADDSWHEIVPAEWTIDVVLSYLQIPIDITFDVLSLTFKHAIPSALIALFNAPFRLLNDVLGLNVVSAIILSALGTLYKTGNYLLGLAFTPVILAVRLLILLPFLGVAFFTSILPTNLKMYYRNSYSLYDFLALILPAVSNWLYIRVFGKSVVEETLLAIKEIVQEGDPEHFLYKSTYEIKLFQCLKKEWVYTSTFLILFLQLERAHDTQKNHPSYFQLQKLILGFLEKLPEFQLLLDYLTCNEDVSSQILADDAINVSGWKVLGIKINQVEKVEQFWTAWGQALSIASRTRPIDSSDASFMNTYNQLFSCCIRQNQFDKIEKLAAHCETAFKNDDDEKKLGEIWGILNPSNPELANSYAVLDKCLVCFSQDSQDRYSEVEPQSEGSDGYHPLRNTHRNNSGSVLRGKKPAHSESEDKKEVVDLAESNKQEKSTLKRTDFF